MLPVIVLYSFGHREAKASPASPACRVWNQTPGTEALGTMTTWDLCDGSKRRAQMTKALPALAPT